MNLRARQSIAIDNQTTIIACDVAVFVIVLFSILTNEVDDNTSQEADDTIRCSLLVKIYKSDVEHFVLFRSLAFH